MCSNLSTEANLQEVIGFIDFLCISYFRCICPMGYEGIRCEINADDCIGNQCQNNATCIDKIGNTPLDIISVFENHLLILTISGSYECQCAGGYSGEFCQTKIPYCSTPEFSPCQNGGRCIDHYTHYTCECKLGFAGENCTININDCVDHMCQVCSIK